MFTLVSHFPKSHPLHLICSSQQLVYQLGRLPSARNRESGCKRWRLFFSFNKCLGIGVVAQQCHRDPGSRRLPRSYLDTNAGFSPSKPPETAAPSSTSGWKAGRKRREESIRDIFALMRKARTFLPGLSLAREGGDVALSLPQPVRGGGQRERSIVVWKSGAPTSRTDRSRIRFIFSLQRRKLVCLVILRCREAGLGTRSVP